MTAIFVGFFVFVFVRLDKFRPILYRFNSLILRGDKSLCVRVCVLSVRGLNNFLVVLKHFQLFWFFFSFIGFGLYHIGLFASYCVVSRAVYVF